MRVQSTFEKITQGTSQNLFAIFFVALRILLGVAAVYLAVQLAHQSGPDVSTGVAGSPPYLMQLSDLKAARMLVEPLLVGMGCLFILGLLVRPVAVVAIIFLILNAFTSGSINPEGVWITNGVIALGLALFAVGGSGHALGLDGIISRNIRRPNLLTKILFG